MTLKLRKGMFTVLDVWHSNAQSQFPPMAFPVQNEGAMDKHAHRFSIDPERPWHVELDCQLHMKRTDIFVTRELAPTKACSRTVIPGIKPRSCTYLSKSLILTPRKITAWYDHW